MADETLQRKIIHCDCDCFYAAVEVRDRPELTGRPVAVGGAAEGRGVVATCNYEARRFGVHSAMPTARALRLCPDLVVLRPDMDKYRDVSAMVRRIFQRFTPHIEPLSLDEAYLDVTGSELLDGSATRIAETIRNATRRELGITISAGVAPNKFLAKIASDWNKPDGLCVIPPATVAEFVQRLPVRKLPGVGPAMHKRLLELGIHYCADLAAADPLQLYERCGSFAGRLLELARGEDDRPVRARSERKSVSVEHTYAEDLLDLAACQRALGDLMRKLRERLQRHPDGRPISRCFVKVRFNDFTTTTAECSATDVAADAIEQLLATAWSRAQRPVRLLGVGVGFKDRSAPREQLLLFEPPQPAADTGVPSPN